MGEEGELLMHEHAVDFVLAGELAEDADIAQTLIELSSQQAAYQAALKAGASIVQNSLMDFLR